MCSWFIDMCCFFLAFVYFRSMHNSFLNPSQLLAIGHKISRIQQHYIKFILLRWHRAASHAITTCVNALVPYAKSIWTHLFLNIFWGRGMCVWRTHTEITRLITIKERCSERVSLNYCHGIRKICNLTAASAPTTNVHHWWTPATQWQ